MINLNIFIARIRHLGTLNYANLTGHSDKIWHQIYPDAYVYDLIYV